ncbi:hypothetical protein PI124_g9746 [Phytophthora idaei]|nr:hypothetical protein PI124_g9746 [Phytophthora idaei]
MDIRCDVAPSDGAVVAEVVVAGRGAQGRIARGRGARGRGGRTGRPAAGTADTTVFVGVRVDDAVSQAAGSARDGHISVAAVPESPQPGSATLTAATGATTTPSRTPLKMLQDVYVSKLIRWLDSQFQGAVEHISVGVVQLGIKNYIAFTRVKNPDWRVLVRPDPSDEIDFEEDDPDEEEAVLQAFDPTELLPISLAEHSDESAQTYLRPEFEYLFEHSASSSFFAYIPLYCWRLVLHETNKYAVVNNIRMQIPFTLDEPMIFLGILVFMAMNDKGEYANYWGLQRQI